MTFYRCEAVREYHGGSEDFIGYANDRIITLTFPLEKETPKGYWIKIENPLLIATSLKWVSKTSNKRYAYPTKKQALEGLIAIKKRAVQYASARVKKARGFACLR